MSDPSVKVVVTGEDQGGVRVLRDVSKEAQSLTSVLEGMGAKAAVALAALGGAGLAKSFADAAMQDRISTMLHNIGETAGYSASAIDGTVSSLRHLGLAGDEAYETTTKLVKADIQLKDATRLAQVALDAAAASGGKYSTVMEQIVGALQSGQQQTLRSLGINTDFKQSYQELADSIGVKVSALTQEQKVEVRLQEVLEKSAALTGSYATSLEHASARVTAMRGALGDLSVDFGKFLYDADTATGVVAGLTRVIEGWSGSILAVRGLMSGLSLDELVAAGHSGGPQGMRDLVDGAAEAERTLDSLRREMDELERQGGYFTTAPLRNELDTLEAQFSSGVISIGRYKSELKSLAAILRAQMAQGTQIIVPDIERDLRGQLDELIEGANKTVLKKTKENRLAALSEEFDPQIDALRQATAQWQKGTEEYARAQDTLNKVIEEKGRQREAILNKGGGKGSGTDKTAMALRQINDEIARLSMTAKEFQSYQFERKLEDLVGKGVSAEKIAELRKAFEQGAQKQQYDTWTKGLQDFEREYQRAMGGAVDMTASITAEMDKFRAAAAVAYDAGVLGAAEYEEQLRRIDELQRNKLLESATDMESGISRAWVNYARDAGNAAKSAESLVTNSFQGMEDAVTQFSRTGKLDFSSMVDSMISDLTRLLYRMAMFGDGSSGSGLVGALGGVISSMFTGGVSSTGGTLGWGGSYTSNLLAAVHHSGGVVGRDASPTRTLPAWLFADAPRYHNGGYIGADERLAVLQTGERVLSRSQNAAYERGGDIRVNINVTNNASDVADTDFTVTPSTNGQINIEATVRRIYRADAARGGLDSVMRGRYGTKAVP